MRKIENFFKLKEHNTTFSTEVLAGVTTFFTMAYVLFVHPQMLAETGLPRNGVYIATILSAVIGTLMMGLYANIPYAQAPGMGLNAFFTYTVVIIGGFTPYEALAMVFVCGVINMIITVTSIRKQLVKAIPETLQQAIGAGIGLFIAYIGLLNVGFINFSAGVPSLTNFQDPNVLLAIIGIAITLILMLKKVKGAILISIIVTTIIGIPMGIVDISSIGSGADSYGTVFADFKSIFGVALGKEGIVSLFTNHDIFKVIPIIFAFSLTDTFDTIGTFIGTGRRSGIFTDEDEKAMETGSGLNSKMERGLFADMVATTAGSILGTSNVTTFVESSAGIGVGGRTGLTSVVTAILFLLSIVAAPVIGLIPSAATAPALIVVGILMAGSFADIEWTNFEDAIPAFFTVLMTVLTYSISNGLAFGFISYILVKVTTGKAKEVHPIVYGSTLLFVINFVIVALG
ncbi:NCS2 family permease [Erysipelothrix inopinata]|uniref:NCS2 family permease n=1 Tax=Erysipelothrix inopinata TaxID=225084 RepID=UPI001FE974D8|nr:NCS2 family permease [Erysipelothrix inopinata]